MELRQLEYFVAVAEEANFTRAAQRIHVAQPAVSAQIARLEKEFGQPLLDRSHRTVRLTAAGEAALPFARQALRAVSDVRTAVDDVSELVRGSVTIGTVTAHNVDMAALLAAFHSAHPAVEITLGTDDSPDALIDGVQSGQARPRDRVRRLRRGARRAGCRGHHRRGIRGGGRRGRPLAPPIVCFVEGAHHASVDRAPGRHRIRRRLDEACAAAKSPVRVAFEASTPLELADLAEHGLGPQSFRRRWLVPDRLFIAFPSCRSCVDGWSGWRAAARSVRCGSARRPCPRARACQRACIE